MRTITLTTVALLTLAAGARADQAAFEGDRPGPAPRVEAPAPWSQQDPADSLYRTAREAMNRGAYEDAARAFNRIWERHPRSAYAPDALYWEAFNRYRIGDSVALERALELLEIQRQRYAEAATRKNGDAQSLSARITGMLARRGNERAAQSVVVAANEVAGMGRMIGEEVAAQMAVVAREMAAQGEIMARELGALGRGIAGAGALSIGGGGIPEECRDEVEPQLAALNALIHMNADRALPVLERVMARRDECSTTLRRRAVFMIADKPSDRTVDMLLDAARNDPDLEVRRQAVFWLAEVDDPRAVEALEQFLTATTDNQIRERAVFALSQHDSPRAREILRRVAGDDGMPAALRARAIFWLGQDGTEQDVAFLKQLFGRTGDSEMDERILFAVGQAGGRQDAEWLLTVAADGRVSSALRQRAIFWAAETGAPAQALGDLYDRIDDRGMKDRILFGLSQSSDSAAIDKLIEIARTESDPELRKKAIFWLGNSNDPRAADVLMDLLAAPRGGGR